MEENRNPNTIISLILGIIVFCILLVVTYNRETGRPYDAMAKATPTPDWCQVEAGYDGFDHFLDTYLEQSTSLSRETLLQNTLLGKRVNWQGHIRDVESFSFGDAMVFVDFQSGYTVPDHFAGFLVDKSIASRLEKGFPVKVSFVVAGVSSLPLMDWEDRINRISYRTYRDCPITLEFNQ